MAIDRSFHIRALFNKMPGKGIVMKPLSRDWLAVIVALVAVLLIKLGIIEGVTW